MTETYPQQLHKIWNGALADDAVPAHSIIMEAMKRAHEAGCISGVIDSCGCVFCDMELVPAKGADGVRHHQVRGQDIPCLNPKFAE